MPSTSELMARMERHDERQRISQTPPEEIYISDLDIAEKDDWDDLQWERAYRSGLLERSGIFDDEPAAGAAMPDDAAPEEDV